jgi:hypothetical protein
MFNETLRSIAISELSEYMGAAAEFAVDDAIAEVNANPTAASHPAIASRLFFIALTKYISVDVPFVKLKESIVRAAQIKG